MNVIGSYLAEIQSTVHRLPIASIERVIQLLHETRLNYQHVFVLGNGGSSATASHFVCDLSKNTRVSGCPDFRVISLSDNAPSFSAYANDEGYEFVFKNQIASQLDPGDVVVAFSASGKSPNVLNAMELANRMGAKTIGFTGSDGGQLKNLAQITVAVPNTRADQIEDIHLMLAHLITRVLGEMAKPSVLVFEPAEEESNHQPAALDQAGEQPILSPQLRRNVMRVIDQSLDTLQEIGQTMTVKQDGDGRYMGRVLLKMIVNFAAVSGSIIVLDEKGKVKESILAYGDQAWRSNRRRMLGFLQDGLAGWVVKNRQGVLIQNTSEDPRWIKHTGNGRMPADYSVLSTPLQIHGQVTGVITLSRPEEDRFTDADLTMLTGMMMTVGYSLHNNSEI